MAMLSTKKFDAMAFTNGAFKNDHCHERVGNLHLNDRLEWPIALANMYDAAIEKYREGVREPENFFTSEEVQFLLQLIVPLKSSTALSKTGVSCGRAFMVVKIDIEVPTSIISVIGFRIMPES